jgi:predicted MPP superfamily phosphohydrolase
VTQVERVHSSDVFIAVVVVATQILIVRLLVRDWRRRLSPHVFRSIMTALKVLWAVVAVGMILSFTQDRWLARWLPPVLRSFLSASEIVWGLVSSSAVTIYLAFQWFLRRVPAYSPGRRQAIRTAAAVAISAPAVLAGYGAFIERTRYRVEEIDFPIPGLHPDLHGIRIAQISDLHVSPFLSVREAGRVVDIANALRPQLTVVTGDLISGFGDPLDATIAELARLRADAGVLGCLGNHEVYAECEDYATAQARRQGIVFLRRQARRLQWGAGVLNVAGVDYQPFRQKSEYLRGAARMMVPGASNLLLSHNPDVFPMAVRQGYDAVVSGHTHGGQVTVEILKQTLNLARFYTPYVAGLYRLDGRSCYVNAGIGTIGMPVRMGAPPEITLLRLRRA